MVILKAYREDPVVSNRLSLEIELQERMRLLVVFDLKAVRKLVELGVSARQRLIAEHSHNGMPELRARPPEHMNSVVIREAYLEIALCYDGSEALATSVPIESFIMSAKRSPSSVSWKRDG